MNDPDEGNDLLDRTHRQLTEVDHWLRTAHPALQQLHEVNQRLRERNRRTWDFARHQRLCAELECQREDLERLKASWFLIGTQPPGQP